MDNMAFNANEIGTMQSAIETYITDVETGLNNIRGMVIGPESGFYGSKQCETVNNYLDQTCNEINSIVRYFDEFKDKLHEVEAAYQAQDAAIFTGDVAKAPSTEGDLVTVNRMN